MPFADAMMKEIKVTSIPIKLSYFMQMAYQHELFGSKFIKY